MRLTTDAVDQDGVFQAISNPWNCHRPHRGGVVRGLDFVD
jgi:hypothetical protein